jgi:2-polyprenyl-3-methyl-5-hydroxy-6-metoxy-1,4-benzoquinol methylase
MDQYKKILLNAYGKTHVDFLDSDNEAKVAWFLNYLRRNYTTYLSRYDKAKSAILEIGCNRGYLLASLNSLGFQHLHGVDISPADIEVAKKLFPAVDFECEDASIYLCKKQQAFDIIILKAVLEHVSKNEVMPFLAIIREALKSNGLVIIDVPNMDWLFASHERYMDFTHEVGFTKESIGQIMRNIFSDVEIIPVDHIRSNIVRNIKTRVARFILNRLYAWADPEGASNPIWARSIIAVGKK